MRKLADKQLFAEIKRTPFGATFRGVDVKSRQLVLVKTFQRRGEQTSAAHAESRFEQEAKIYAAISHPNVVRLLEYGVEKDVKYLVLEYVDGQTLRALLQRDGSQRALPAEIAVALFWGIADGLTALHQKNIIHRDLKPENILIAHDGTVKICDFDLAISGKSQHSNGLTGTTGYLAPEAILGEPVTTAADIFSAGILLYEMLTGTRPFETGSASGDMNAAVQMAHLPAHKINPDVPALFDELLSELLAKKPVQRSQNANEIRSWLNRHFTLRDAKKRRELLYRFLSNTANFAENGIRHYLKPVASEQKVGRSWPRWAVAALSTIAVALIVWQISQSQRAKIPALQNPQSNDSIAVLQAEPAELSPQDTVDDSQQLPIFSESVPENTNDTAGSSAQPSVRLQNSAGAQTNAPPLRREIFVQSHPWAYIFVNGDSLGLSPLAQPVVLPEGQHDFVLKKPLFPVVRFSVSIDSATADTLDFQTWDHVAVLELKIIPWAELSIHGAPAEVPEDAGELILSPGQYRMDFRHPELGERSETFYLQAGERRALTVNLFAKK